MANESLQLFQSTQTLFDFIDALKMQVSIKKSWFWGSSNKLRKELRSPPDSLRDIQVINYAVDLGCDQNYTRKIQNGKQKVRVEKARRVLKKIAKKTLPKRFRPIITQSAGFGAVAYGIELSRVADSTWAKLRTAVAGALDRNAAGPNPFLACICNKSPCDPQLRAVVRTIMFWRRYFRCFQGAKENFCQIVTHPPKNGPCAIFAKRLSDIGWNPQPNGIIMRNDGFSFNWTTCSSMFLRKTLRRYWDSHIVQRVQHRKDFDITSIDEYNIYNNIQKFPEKSKSALQTYIAGAAFTRDVVSKYSQDGETKCPYCDCQDSRLHRLVQCPKFDSIRSQYKKVIQWLDGMPLTTATLAIIPRNIGAVSTIIEHQKLWPPNIVPLPDEQHKHVFSDGSAFWQDQPTCTLSASAAVTTDQSGEIREIIAAMPVPGMDQNSYRAKIFGVLLSIQHTYSLTIYCDCLGVVDKMNNLLESHNQGTIPKICDHWDIWFQVWEQISKRPPNCIDICKVKAHVDASKVTCPFEKWIAISNDKVDKLAKSTVVAWEPTYSSAKRAYEKIQKDINMHYQLCQLIVKIGDSCDENRVASNPIRETPSYEIIMPNPMTCYNFEVVYPDIRCPFGDTFCDRVVAWAKKLKWPNPPQGNISILELYIDFVLDSGTLTPVPIKYANDGRVTTYGLRDTDPEAKVVVHNLAQQNIIWNRFLKWSKKNNILLWELDNTINTNCLGHVGYSLRSPALTNRPILTQGNHACKRLHDIFHSSNGKIRTLSVAFNGP